MGPNTTCCCYYCYDWFFMVPVNNRYGAVDNIIDNLVRANSWVDSSKNYFAEIQSCDFPFRFAHAPVTSNCVQHMDELHYLRRLKRILYYPRRKVTLTLTNSQTVQHLVYKAVAYLRWWPCFSAVVDNESPPLFVLSPEARAHNGWRQSKRSWWPLKNCHV